MKYTAPTPKVQFFDQNCDPLSGGKVYTYEQGTTTPLETFTDASGGTPNSNPIILDSEGMASIWYSSTPYTIAVYDADDVLQGDGGDVNPYTIPTLSELDYTRGDTGAVSRTLQERLEDLVLVEDYGIVGDGSTNDTAGFDLLETNHTGVYIDLMGRSYVVNSIPEKCKYYNGDWIVGSTKTSLRRNRLDHPLDGNQWVAIGNGISHYWLFGLGYDEVSDQLAIFNSPAWRHAQSYSSPLNVAISQDKGQTIERERTIHSVDGWDIGDCAAGQMGSDRIGALVSVREQRKFYISNITQANPGVITTTATHGFSTGESIDLERINGMTELNGETVIATVLTSTTFSIGVDTTSYTAYVSGGTATAPDRYRYDFVYSDNALEDWTVSTSVIPSPDGSMVYGPLHSYPTSVGGNDTAGYMAFGYFGSTTYAIYTTDNGNTWTSTSILTDFYVEPSLVKVPEEDKWVLFLRKNGDSLFISTSTDMLTWTTPVETGINLLSNPVYAIVEGGRVYVYLAIRDFSKPFGEQNDVICIEDDVAAVYAGSDFTNTALRQVITGTERNLGYFKHVKIGQDYIFGYTAGEYDVSTNDAADAYIVLGSTRRAPVAGVGYTKQIKSNPNFVRNPVFHIWDRGDTFSSFTTTTKTASSWTVNPSGATVTVDRITISAATSRLLPFSSRYALRIVATADDFVNLYQEYKGEEELFRFAENNVTLQVWGIGDTPDGLYGQITFDYGVGGSSSESNLTNFKISEGPNNVWTATVTIQTPYIEDQTIGTDPFVRLSIAASGNATWDMRFLGVKGEFGSYASRFNPVDYEEERKKVERYVQVLEFDSFDQIMSGLETSTTSFWGVLHYPKMRENPTASLLEGAAADLEIYPRSVFASSVSFNEETKDRCSFRWTAAGLTTDRFSIGRVKSGSSVKILLDTE